MANVGIIRKDSNGHIISKDNKDYHISFNQKVKIIQIESYKKWNILTSSADVEDLFFGDIGNNDDDDEEEYPRNKPFIEIYKNDKKKNNSHKSPNGSKRTKCCIF